MPNRISINSDVGGQEQPQPVSLASQQPKQSDMVNIVFTWNFGGEQAFLIGSFN